MPAGVIYIVCIPSSNYEHVLKFGRPKDIISLHDSRECDKQYRLEVELRNKKSRSIPIHLTQEYYNDAFNPTLENISEDDELITMENVSETFLNSTKGGLKENALHAQVFPSFYNLGYFK